MALKKRTWTRADLERAGRPPSPRRVPRWAVRWREYRLRRRLTQTEAARRIGCQQSHLSDVERGRRHPPRRVLVRAASVYGVAIEALVDEAERLPAGVVRKSPKGGRKV